MAIRYAAANKYECAIRLLQRSLYQTLRTLHVPKKRNESGLVQGELHQS